MSFDAELGPLNYVVVTFESLPLPAAGFTSLAGLADAGRIRILDVEFVRRAADGAVAVIDAAEAGMPDFTGATTGLIDADDVATAAQTLRPGGVAVVVVYEDLSIVEPVRRWEADGGIVVAEGPIVVDELLDALDATDTPDTLDATDSLEATEGK
ncbi:DUF6325 family protein [Gordonia polyisoprenivorans]|uniref:DUF6325 family protein n=1 Tax=Gordonia polyisoprenivorans TaxID=84595 RepID=UPI001AD66D03|nr:DUF6325 family protein [Gordonia polyisoprenivorans]QTI70428.1 hypothetical protein J6U32_07675 [Gordonia polyisoprenivorans]